MRRRRFRGVGVEWRGFLYALVEDRRDGRVLKVYHRLGKWRLYGSDETAPSGAIPVARRLLRNADYQAAFERWREGVQR